MNSKYYKGGLLLLIYHILHPSVDYEKIPDRYKFSVIGMLLYLIRRFVCQNIAPNCVIAPVRVWLYKLCGFKIGNHVFIGMKCYLDDMCVDAMVIEDNVTISYGVYFACHGVKQGSNHIIIREGAYIGMRSSIIARNDLEVGKNTVIGAMSLVNKSIPENVTAAGVPCRVISK